MMYLNVLEDSLEEKEVYLGKKKDNKKILLYNAIS